MHGLVMIAKDGKPIRNSIIWCDSRAVDIGNKAFDALGQDFCLSHLLNSPGNFTASKLAWVQKHEPKLYQQVYKVLLPGDYVAYRLTNQCATTASGLSEGIFWDFKRQTVSDEVLGYFGFSKDVLPELVDTFSFQGCLSAVMGARMGIPSGIPVTYRAGDQPNNAFSLNVLSPGEVAATAGTSGVIYGVSEAKKYDPQSRVNTFLHVNNEANMPRIGILFCLNSVGIFNAWARHELLAPGMTYTNMNLLASSVPEGSEGLLMMPFGNGSERMLSNRNQGASIHGLNLNRHHKGHLLRALQESIAYAFAYGIELMEPLGLDLNILRAGQANLFLSPVFTQTLSNLINARIELYDTNGAEGAARGAAIGVGYYPSIESAFVNFNLHQSVHPAPQNKIKESYSQWKELLAHLLKS
jgi:xylulokinase